MPGSPKPKLNSAVVIAKLLGTEGFSEHTANEVKRYWGRRSGLTDRQQNHIEQLKTEFSQIMASLTVGQRLIIGKYIGLLNKQQFDTGLKVGLQAFASLNGHDIDLELHTPPLEKIAEPVPLEKYKAVKGQLRTANKTIRQLRKELPETTKE